MSNADTPRRASIQGQPSRPRRMLLVALAAVALGVTLASPVPARACGMRAFYRSPPRPSHNPSALLAQARRHLIRKENVSALLGAQLVLDKVSADAATRAEAWAIIGWVRWQSGKRAEALQAMERGRALDDDATRTVLVRLGDTSASRAFRKAVGA